MDDCIDRYTTSSYYDFKLMDGFHLGDRSYSYMIYISLFFSAKNLCILYDHTVI
jgi:hypothetical protein